MLFLPRNVVCGSCFGRVADPPLASGRNVAASCRVAGFLCAAVCAMLGGGGEAVKVGAIPVEAEGRYPFAIAPAPLTFLT